MALSAADLQKRLEGAPDPFPSLSSDTPTTKGKRNGTEPLNTESESLFPSLAPSAAPQASSKSPAAVWNPSTRAKPVSAPVYSDSFVLNQVESVRRTKDNKPLTVSDVIKNVQTKFKVKVELSSQLKSSQTTFNIRGDSQKNVDAAKKALVSDLSPVIKIKVEAPLSVIGAIVGPKGATLKQIRDQTNVKIDIPRRDNRETGNTLAVPGTNGHGSSHVSSRSTSPLPSPVAEDHDEDSEQTTTITIEGAASMAHEAQLIIQGIISEKTSRTSQKVKDIPAHVYPFALLRRVDFLRVAEGREVNLAKDDKERTITVSGDREAVGKVVETIRSCVTFYEGDLSMVKISLPKRQHHLLVGTGAEEILNKSKCAVIVPSADGGEDVFVWGKPKDLGPGLQAVMERAASQHTASVPIGGAHPSQILTYLHKSGHVKTLEQAHPNVHIHLPPATATGPISVDFSGTKAEVDAAQKELTEFIKSLAGSTKGIEVDSLIHKILQAKAGKQLKGYHANKNVLVYFPTEYEESSQILLVYDPHGDGVKAVSEKKKILSEVESELLAIVKTLGEIKIETLTVEKKWHDAIKGKNGSHINAIIGEDRALAIQVGPDDTITIRGSPADVSYAVKEINKAVEEAKTDEIESGHSLEFSIAREYVARIVGAGGAGIQKLREALDVKIDIDDAREAEQVVGKKKNKTTTSGQSVIKVTGRQRSIEEAKKRILAQVDKMADETIEVLRIPRQYHSGIIGTQGKYIQRLQDKYGVKINMPKEDSAKTDEVTIKGGKKGVSGAKQEINELVDFEKENNNVVNFTVPSRAVARILGQKGAKINDIAAETGAKIDIAKDEGGTTAVTLRGTKKACAAAKTAILAISDSVEEETTITLKIEPKFHRTIIGGGGVGLKNLLARVGGPTESREQAGLVKFPQPPNSSDEVIVRGEKNLAKKVAAELERVVTSLRERVVLGVVIPNQHHKSLIGHGGQPLTELEKKTGAEVQFPGSRSYHQVAAPSNAEELGDAEEKDIVKVAGSPAACEKAISELKTAVAAIPVRAERKDSERGPRQQSIGKVAVPFKHFYILQQNSNLMRDLRAVGVYTNVNGKPTPAAQSNGAAPSTRIDDDPTEDNTAQEAHGVEWKTIEYGSDVQAGDAELVLKARDAESLAIAENLVKEAVAKADKSTKTAYMTFPDRGVFPRIIGNKGSVISELCLRTEADINVPRDDSTITIHGSDEAVNNAKTEILGIAFGRRGGPGGAGRRHSDRRQGRD